MFTRRALAIVITALLSLSGVSTVFTARRARAKRPSKPLPLLTLPLLVRVARCKGRRAASPRVRARSRRWVDARLAATRQVLARHRIRLQVERGTFTPTRCTLLGRSHRHQIAAHVSRRDRITVLVLSRIRDLDVPSYDLMGVHWRYRGKKAAWRGRRYVLLTARAHPLVLVHELCHFLGLHHDKAGGNLMTPGPSDPIWKTKKKPRPFVPRLSASQGRRIRHGLRAFLAGAAADVSRRPR